MTAKNILTISLSIFLSYSIFAQTDNYPLITIDGYRNLNITVK